MSVRRLLSAAVAGITALALFPSAGGAAAVEKGRYIVVLEDGVDAARVAAQHEVTHGLNLGFVYQHALKGYSAQMPAATASLLSQDPRVDYIERDLPQAAFAQTLPTGVNRIDGELSTTANINGVDERVNVDVAIIDSGVDLDHPDLNVVASAGCASGGPSNNVCTTGAGDDNNGHGTHVAGITAAVDNTIGVVGVAPGARIHAVKVLDSRGNGYTSWIIAGIDWVTARSATIEVANMSLGGTGYSAAYRTAIQNSVNRGIVYVVAAGNSARDVYGADLTFGTSDDTMPASFPEVSTISALADADGRPGGATATSTAFSICTENRDDSMACFSNFSQRATNNPVTSPGAKIDLALPGYKITSTYMNGQYASTSGTSQASPHAAGLAALYIARNGRATSAAGVYSIRQSLINSGHSMSGTTGLTTFDDRDANRENIGWAAGL